jgi:hypothetical protein
MYVSNVPFLSLSTMVIRTLERDSEYGSYKYQRAKRRLDEMLCSILVRCS